MHTYQTALQQYQSLYRHFSQTDTRLGILRLAVAAAVILLVVQYFRAGGLVFAGSALAGAALFLYLVRRHAAVVRRKQFYRQLIQVNEHELAALKGDFSHFADGAQYVDPEHPYTYDLDIFGKNSLFQYLNRTANAIGSDRLARYFLQDQSKREILDTQAAVRDLAPRFRWRQELLAEGQLHADQASAYRNLLQWAEQPVSRTALPLRILYYTLTVATAAVGLGLFLVPISALGQAFKILTALNLVVVVAHAKKIKTELEQINAMHKIVGQYGHLLQCIEKETFEAEKLRGIQGGLNVAGRPASAAILQLSGLLHQLESVQNLLGALIFNSLFVYHVHVLLALEKWKLRYAGHIRDWIDAAGEMEALSSLAHFAFNNPDFVFPEIADTARLKIEALGHPLIPAEKRVCNDIQFEKPGFVILTGSNMSGKSTFLRTLGINLLLAKTGAPVCAAACAVYPFDIFVCMKLSDSLHDNESYFYAELKRLKRIIEHLEAGPAAFLLLDEVLRGTNSNDKLSGTLGLLETMVRLRATGVLATHDLSVCDLAAQYPDALRNMCFEVEMTADNLVFDYRLRNGVCVNKSASFLMKKMGVIT